MMALAASKIVDDYDEFIEVKKREQSKRPLDLSAFDLAREGQLRLDTHFYQVVPQIQPTFLGSGLSIPITLISEWVTRDAEAYTKSLGLYGAFVLAKELVFKVVPSLTALHVDLVDDPEEDDYRTICFTISTQSSVEDILKSDYILQSALIRQLPARALMSFSFTYRFE